MFIKAGKNNKRRIICILSCALLTQRKADVLPGNSNSRVALKIPTVLRAALIPATKWLPGEPLRHKHQLEKGQLAQLLACTKDKDKNIEGVDSFWPFSFSPPEFCICGFISKGHFIMLCCIFGNVASCAPQVAQVCCSSKKLRL